MAINQFFSNSKPTIEAAQALHEYDLFNPAAIFQLIDGSYVYGCIREMDSPPHRTALELQPLGYTMVAYHGALINVWKSYPDNRPI